MTHLYNMIRTNIHVKLDFCSPHTRHRSNRPPHFGRMDVILPLLTGVELFAHKMAGGVEAVEEFGRLLFDRGGGTEFGHVPRLAQLLEEFRVLSLTRDLK